MAADKLRIERLVEARGWIWREDGAIEHEEYGRYLGDGWVHYHQLRLEYDPDSVYGVEVPVEKIDQIIASDALRKALWRQHDMDRDSNQQGFIMVRVNPDGSIETAREVTPQIIPED